MASQVVTTNGRWPTMLAFMQERFSNVSESTWQQRFTNGDVLDANGRPLSCTAPFKNGQRIYYSRHVDDEITVPFKEQIVFEDELIIVADKPHFLPTVPGGQYVEQTLLRRLQQSTSNPNLIAAHRLDRETAGLVLLVKNARYRGVYQQLFATRLVQKIYHAIAPFNQTLRLPLDHEACIEESDHFMQMRVCDGPMNSHTHIAILRTVAHGRCHFILRPTTGRKHQLRLHMASLSMPILGDQIYPIMRPFEPIKEARWDDPLQLLAQGLAFIDPVTQFERSFTSTLTLKTSV